MTPHSNRVWNRRGIGSRSIAAVLFAAIIASNAVASDGVLEINDTCAAVGCFTGDTPGLPVTTQSNQSYVLTSSIDIRLTALTAIVLADGSTLDMNGFSLTGPISCTGPPSGCSASGSGVGIDGGDGITVRNGSIRGFGSHGLIIGDKAIIEGLHIEQNAGDGLRGGGRGSTLSNCIVALNGGHGFYLGALGTGFSDGSVVRNNNFFRNEGDGVRGDRMLLVENTAISNGGFGFNMSIANGNSGFLNNLAISNNGGATQPQTSGGLQLGSNYCGNNTTCP